MPRKVAGRRICAAVQGVVGLHCVIFSVGFGRIGALNLEDDRPRSGELRGRSAAAP